MNKRNSGPPQIFLRFFRWFCHPELRDYIEGDLMELYRERFNKSGKRNADFHFILDVILLIRPGIIKPENKYYLNNYAMFKNYFKIGIRNIRKNKGFSFINIAGLAVGMSVAMLIGLWIWNEISFNRSNPDFRNIAMVIQNVSINGNTNTWFQTPFPLGEEMRRSYGNDFKYVLTASSSYNHVLAYHDKFFTETGAYFEPEVTRMLHLNLLQGTSDGLKDPSSVMISESTARKIFGETDPMNRIIIIDNKTNAKVTGVYKDLPENSSFSDLHYILPWEQLVRVDKLNERENPWRSNSYFTYVQLAGNSDLQMVSEKIRDIKMHNVRKKERSMHPQLFLFPMSKWHLYNNFRDGMNAGGRIEYVWLFGIIGVFVLMLACINFMNLSTAHSEKRLKEIGVRKVSGSRRGQLIQLFYSESVLIAFFAFSISLILVYLFLPFFNELTGIKLTILWGNPLFWMAGAGFVMFTGILAGSYPAMFLSSFKPVRILKGTIRQGHTAVISRRILVVFQFTISVILIVGTIIVFRQVQFAKERHIGFNRNGLLMIYMITADIHKHFDAVKNELIHTGAITDMAESSSPVTQVWSTNSGFNWPGKDPDLAALFPNTEVTFDYGKTVGWQFIQGRDFSRDHPSDSNAFVINESAMKFMDLNDPVGQTITLNGNPYMIIGVIKDVIMDSPYEPVRPSVFHLAKHPGNVVLVKLNPSVPTEKALQSIETAFKKYSSSQPFNYSFADEEYNKKFGNEQQIGKLASYFSFLAIFISCLGIFGLSSYMAERRTKEIGIRKVLGASVLNLWQLLSGDFLLLIFLSCLIATPIAWYFLHKWLLGYSYRTEISWWIFVITSIGALIITVVTISFQTIRAAMRNPVNSLRSE